jgi:hypothetical protein
MSLNQSWWDKIKQVLGASTAQAAGDDYLKPPSQRGQQTGAQTTSNVRGQGQPAPATAPAKAGFKPANVPASKEQTRDAFSSVAPQGPAWQPPDYGPTFSFANEKDLRKYMDMDKDLRREDPAAQLLQTAPKWEAPTSKPQTYGPDYWNQRGFGGYDDYLRDVRRASGGYGDSPFGLFGQLTKDNMNEVSNDYWLRAQMGDYGGGGGGSGGGSGVPFVFNQAPPSAPSLDRSQPQSFNMKDPYPAPQRGQAPTYQQPASPPPIFQRDSERYRKLLGY